MTTQHTRTALITGASRGLGLALARALARRGWRLIIDARGAEAARVELAALTCAGGGYNGCQSSASTGLLVGW